ncbi:aminoacyl-tRNA hydrolase [Candidatus Saccharibacteria bacterium]|nr:aminoacyl-tRNA hydrolase [Candidatus Saccharibacteria bacterium]
MKLIVGLGNPGTKYNFTRHNTGFLALDYYAKATSLRWNETSKFNAIWGRTGDTIFIKPQGYYNDSGTVVASFLHYYKIDISDLLVICDNFDLALGLVRYRATGSAGGNNGLKSIDKALGTNDYARIRVGTGNDELRSKMGDIDFVLSKFTPEEKEKLPSILSEVLNRINVFIGAE